MVGWLVGCYWGLALPDSISVYIEPSTKGTKKEKGNGIDES